MTISLLLFTVPATLPYTTAGTKNMMVTILIIPFISGELLLIIDPVSGSARNASGPMQRATIARQIAIKQTPAHFIPFFSSGARLASCSRRTSPLYSPNLGSTILSVVITPVNNKIKVEIMRK